MDDDLHDRLLSLSLERTPWKTWKKEDLDRKPGLGVTILFPFPIFPFPYPVIFVYKLIYTVNIVTRSSSLVSFKVL